MNWHSELWAKHDGDTAYPLYLHLLDTASATHALWRAWLRPGLRSLIASDIGADETRAEKIVAFVCAGHDIGKANPIFQGQYSIPPGSIKPWMEAQRKTLKAMGYHQPTSYTINGFDNFVRRHEQVGAMRYIPDLEQTGLDYASAFWQALITLGHHGRFSLSATDNGLRQRRELIQGLWPRAQDDLAEALHAACDMEGIELPDEVPVRTTLLLSGLTILADRMASLSENVGDAQTRMLSGGLDPDNGSAWIERRIPFFSESIRKNLGIYNDFENAKISILGEYSPRGAQRLASGVSDGLWMVMAQTGSGKTEAAFLRHAQQPEAIKFLLPTQATANAMMHRVQKIYSNTHNVAALANAMASLEEFYTHAVRDAQGEEGNENGLFPTDFVRHGSARLLAPVFVGTIDQALMAALPMKWTHLRMLALANAHIVVDEAHTMDYYQMILFERLIAWLGQVGARVTVLTATLPSRQAERIAIAYQSGKALDESSQPDKSEPVLFPSAVVIPPSLSTKRAQRDRTRETLDTRNYTIDVECEEADDPVQAHLSWLRTFRTHAPKARLGIVLNTIDRAIRVARELQTAGKPFIILHSRMTAEHRRLNTQAMTELLGKRGDAEGITIIGTQAIEASLDIDLDAMSTDLAPAASLIQRAGRVWRFDDSRRELRAPGLRNLLLHIVRGTQQEGFAPYMEAHLLRVWDEMENRANLKIPEDLQEFVERDEVDIGELLQGKGMSDASQNELAKIVRSTQKGKQFVHCEIKETLTFADFYGLTKYDAVTEDEFPATRLIENDSRRIIFVGDSVSRIPGGWLGSKDALLKVKSDQPELMQKAMGASLSVSGGMLKKLRDAGTLEPLGTSAAGLLQDILAGDCPTGFVYDPCIGLMEISKA